MNLLPFGKLPAHKPRKFVPQTIDLGDWPQIAPLFDQLENARRACRTAADLERWLLDWSELNAALDEESSRRYIAMTCHTDNAEAEKAYLHFVEHVEPQLKPRQFALEKIYVHPQRTSYTSPKLQTQIRDSRSSSLRGRYAVFDRDVKNHVELFRPGKCPAGNRGGQALPAIPETERLAHREFSRRGKDAGPDGPLPRRTGPRAAAGGVGTGRQTPVAGSRTSSTTSSTQQIKLRQQIAHNAGFENYRDYAFRRLGRFDYTPDDCAKFHDAVEQHVMPVLRELQAERRAQLKLDKLRPWDLAVDPLNRPPLKPFAQVDEMVSRTQKIFDRLDGELGGGFQQMQDLRLLDLDNRKGKAPGGYQSTLTEARVPFIFMNAVGLQRDVETILHEAGHAFHALATRDEDLHAYRNAPIEFCEVASMSMELLGNEFIEEFYSAADANRARRVHLEGIVGVFPVDCDGGRLPALDLHAPGPHARRADAGVAGFDGPFWRRRGLERVRSRAGQSLAPAAAHFPAPVLLHRIRHRATRRVAGLGQFQARQGEGVERLQESPGAGRLAAVAGIVFRRRLPV